jgi:hypothetical protein
MIGEVRVSVAGEETTAHGGDTVWAGAREWAT